MKISSKIAGDKVLFRKIRTACLTLEALLVWCSTFGLLLTILTGAVTLNRIIHYAPPVEPKPIKQNPKKKYSTTVKETLPERFRKISAFVMQQQSGPSSSYRPRYDMLGEHNGSFDIDDGAPESSAGFDESGGPRRPGGLGETEQGSEHRTQALEMLAEFLRNRKISRHQVPVAVTIEEPDQATSSL